LTTTLKAAALDERSRTEILSPDALAFLAELHGRFGGRRRELLAARAQRHAALRAGGTLDFLPETREIREGDWRVAAPRDDYADRRVEITGPTDRKLVINALNSGARGFMADFEDANSPTWVNQVSGHVNLVDAIEGTITYNSSDGRHYALGDDTATLLVRPRGWHLDERHLAFDDGEPFAGAFLDFGLFAFHGAPRLHAHGLGAYLYLPKLEHHLEARLWEDVLTFSEEALGLPRGTFRATVLIETLPAAFQMDEILYELRDHSYGLNAGRWDYIFSMIKSFRDRPEFVLPDRNDVKMTVPFMSAYAQLLVKTCHARGAFAMGGMAALIPSRTDPEANQRAIDAVRADKEREAGLGFDGTWVAHPDVVSIARAAFDAVLGDRPNQIDRRRDDVQVGAAELLDAASTPGAITEAGLRNDLSVGFQYISFWLGGRGAAGINNLMEDAATAEISRSQVWQWIRHGVRLEDGRVVTRDLVRTLLDEELAKIRAAVGEETWAAGRPEQTRAIFEQVALAEDLPEFLTIPAYELLDDEPAGDRAPA
jgi:malate synthase